MKSEEDMTPEEIRERLREMGIPVDAWQDNPDPGGDVEITTIPTFERIAENLRGLSTLVEDRIEKDKQQIAELNLKMARLKHGGGR